VRALIDTERRRRGLTGEAVAQAEAFSTRTICAPDTGKRGFRRWVIARRARCFDSPELARLAESDLYWDRVVDIEPVGIRETYDLHVEEHHNFMANDLVVHNSHASSFALLAYASAYLKVHHAAAFYAALLNNQPMGFYHAATIVKDAQRRRQRILPVDVTRSAWPCTIEGDAVRLGLNQVKGLRERAGHAMVAGRAARAFTSVDDVARRAGLERAELTTLAAIGAFAALGGTRRAHLWTVARPLPGAVFGDLAPDRPASPLRDMDAHERLAADYQGTGVTLGPHPMALRRPELARRPGRPILRAIDLRRGSDGERVRVAGNVIVRQRPGTAKGFVFLSLEDETGIANVIVTPGLFARHRLVLVTEPFLVVEGILQTHDNVVSLRAQHITPLPRGRDHVPSHDFG
jgi:error-prone DNA polymerase